MNLEKFNDNQFTEDGRELQEQVGSIDNNKRWSERQIERFNLKENIDYRIATGGKPLNGGIAPPEYFFTKQAAKI